MRPIPTIGDPERYIDSAFVDSAFIELKSCDLWDVKMLYPILHMDHACLLYTSPSPRDA